MKVSNILSLSLVTAVTTILPMSNAAAQMADHGTMHKMEMGEEKSGWKELDAFHMLMAATWHPVAKSNDLTAIRAKAPALAAAAKTWSSAKLPKECDTKPIREAITAVDSGSANIATLVAKRGSDADVKAALRALHMRFEVVEEGCKPTAK